MCVCALDFIDYILSCSISIYIRISRARAADKIPGACDTYNPAVSYTSIIIIHVMLLPDRETRFAREINLLYIYVIRVFSRDRIDVKRLSRTRVIAPKTE